MVEGKCKKIDEKTVTLNFKEFKEGTCKTVKFGDDDKRVVCKEKGKLKIFELCDSSD